MLHKIDKDTFSFSLHYSLIRFGESINVFFGPIIFYLQDYSIITILLIWIMIHMSRLLIRPSIAILTNKIGNKLSMILGTVGYIFLYPLFSLALSMPEIFLGIFIFYLALMDCLYWMPQHTFFSILGEHHNKGKDTAFREGLSNTLGILSPIVSGAILFYLGHQGLFIFGAIIYILSLIPLLFIIEKRSEIDFKKYIFNVNKTGLFASSSQSFLYQAYQFIWIIVLYLIYNDLINTGNILSVAILLKVVLFYMIGALIDNKSKKSYYVLGAIIIAITIIGKTFFIENIFEIIFLEIILIIGFSLYQPYIDILLYKLTKESESPLIFQLYSETGWDIGVIMASTILIIFFSFYDNIRFGMLFSILALPTGVFIIYNWYKKHTSYKLDI